MINSTSGIDFDFLWALLKGIPIGALMMGLPFIVGLFETKSRWKKEQEQEFLRKLES